MFAITIYQPDTLKAATTIADSIDRFTATLERIGKQMSTDMQALVDQVAATTAVEASAVALIQGIVAKLEASAGDAAAVASLTQQLKDATQPLADAVAANTTPPAPPADNPPA